MRTFNPEHVSEALKLVRVGALREAVRLHRSIYKQFNDSLFPDLSEADLRECLYTPLPVFSFCTSHELRELRERMAAGLVVRSPAFDKNSGCTWGHPMSAKAVDQNFWMSVYFHRNYSDWKASGVVLRARIAGSCDGPCEVCKAAAVGDYPLNELPRLPHAGCLNLNTVGCRCCAIATKIKGIDR